MRVALIVLAGSGLWPASAFGQEAFAGKAYFLACGEEGCFLNAAGYDLFVAPDQGAELLGALPMLAAVEVEGTLSGMGDSSAMLALTSVRRIADDPYEGNLVAMQGDWRPVGEENPFIIGIYGMDWTEILMEEVQDRFMMTVGDACADGTMHQGMVINLFRYGDDPGADACWLLEYVESGALVLRDLGGDFGLVEFERAGE